MSNELPFWERVRRLARIARGEFADMDLVLSKLLLWMVRSSILVLLFGLLLVGLTGFQFPHKAIGFDRLVGEVLELSSAAILDLGIVLLISVPIMRVAVSMGLFARKGDLIYTAMTALVLVILSAGFFLGTGL